MFANDIATNEIRLPGAWKPRVEMEAKQEGHFSFIKSHVRSGLAGVGDWERVTADYNAKQVAKLSKPMEAEKSPPPITHDEMKQLEKRALQAALMLVMKCSPTEYPSPLTSLPSLTADYLLWADALGRLYNGRSQGDDDDDDEHADDAEVPLADLSDPTVVQAVIHNAFDMAHSFDAEED